MIFNIDREKWARKVIPDNTSPGGQKNPFGNSKLLNEQGNMCCLGFVCQQLGVPEAKLNGAGFPHHIGNWTYDGANQGATDKQKDALKVVGLLAHDGMTSPFSFEAAKINDDAYLDDEAKETFLRSIFRSHGHDLVFSGPRYVAPKPETPAKADRKARDARYRARKKAGLVGK